MFPDLGYGIGLRRKHYPQLLEHGPGDVEWFETISEDYFVPGGRPWHVLERMRSVRPIVLHGVALGIGNPDPIAHEYLKQLEAVIERVQPAWVSDHLCFGADQGTYAHELLPMPYDDESLAHVSARVDMVQSWLRRPLVLENVSAYAAFARNGYEEVDFINALVRRTGCKLLLDVNNVYVCSRNLGLDAERYVDTVDARAIVQLHLAGHSEYGDHVMDTHVGPVPDSVWALYRRLIARTGPISTLIEWDSDVPAYDVVAAEARRAREIAEEVGRAQAA